MGRDLELLLQDWKEDRNPRTAFHIANRYRMAGNLASALSWYLQRIQMSDGWREEVVVSASEAAKICRVIGQSELAGELESWGNAMFIAPLLNLT
jgi:hypothetical protein